MLHTLWTILDLILNFLHFIYTQENMKAFNQYGFMWSLVSVRTLDNRGKLVLSFRSLLFYTHIL